MEKKSIGRIAKINSDSWEKYVEDQNLNIGSLWDAAFGRVLCTFFNGFGKWIYFNTKSHCFY